MNSKWVAVSKTIIGAVIAYILPAVLRVLGYEPSAETITSLNTTVEQLLNTVGMFLAIYGLRDAQGGLTFKPPSE